MQRAVVFGVISLSMACGGGGLGAGTGGAGTQSASASASSGGAAQSSSSTTTSTTTSASTTSSGAGGQGGSHAGMVPIFVAQGHLGRTTISCDGGKTWVANHSDDDSAVCFDMTTDCDHSPGAANGVAFGDGYFYATFGWGQPGAVKRSKDGVTWDSVVTGKTFGGMAFGAGHVLAGSRNPQASADDGATWTPLAEVPLSIYNIREVGFAPFDKGRFVLVGSDGMTRQIAVSSDAGASWTLPSFPSDCDVSFYRSGGIAYGGGAIVVTDGGQGACRSTDGGATWTRSDMGQSIASTLIWTGKELMGWGGGKVVRSADGATWTAQTITPADADIGIVGVDDAGKLVAVSGGWGAWYDKQHFYRSDDGVSWEVLPAGSFVGSHPITAMTFGWASPSAACP